MVFIDPIYAQGYSYNITKGMNAVTKVVLPVLAGDTDGYQVLDLMGNLLGGVAPGGQYSFSTPVQGFKVLGIDLAAMVDPTNPAGFVTGLEFLNGNTIEFAQQAIPFPTEVPEPASLALLSLGLLGLSRIRRRNKSTA